MVLGKPQSLQDRVKTVTGEVGFGRRSIKFSCGRFARSLNWSNRSFMSQAMGYWKTRTESES